jgi:hypothetical protein
VFAWVWQCLRCEYTVGSAESKYSIALVGSRQCNLVGGRHLPLLGGRETLSVVGVGVYWFGCECGTACTDPHLFSMNHSTLVGSRHLGLVGGRATFFIVGVGYVLAWVWVCSRCEYRLFVHWFFGRVKILI